MSNAVFCLQKNFSCKYVDLIPRPPKRSLDYVLPKRILMVLGGGTNPLEWDKIIEKRQTQLKEKARWFKDYSPGKLLNIRAQKGEFIWQMRQGGWEVEGVELDSSVPNPTNLPIQFGDFLDIDFNDGEYDDITFWAVLEHVYEPRLFFERVSRLLQPGGCIVGIVTNINSIQARVYQADDYPRHLTIFSKKSLNLLCNENNMELSGFKTDQRLFGGALTGGLVYAAKRLFGYTLEETFSEWKQIKDPDLFSCQWRAKPSIIVKNISRADRIFV